MPHSSRIVLVLLALLITKTGWGQGGLPQIMLKDQASGTPIEKVHLRDLSSAQLWISDHKGIVILNGIEFPAELIISHIGYEEMRIALSGEEFEADHSLEILVKPRMVMLDPVEITLPGPQIVHQPADLHVGAYHVNSEGVWVLVYEKMQMWHREENAGAQVLRGARLHLLDPTFRQIASVHFATDVKELIHDHLQRPIVVTSKDAFIAERSGEQIELSKIDRQTLDSAVLPWKAQIGGKLIGSDQRSDYPAFSYIAFDPTTSESREICAVEDERTMQLFRSQYKYMSGRDKVIAMDMEIETGIDREIIAGYMTGFHNDLYYHEPYAPVFVVNHTICIFDHSIDRIRRFDRDLSSINEIPIEHHEQRSWSSILIQDPISRKIYSVHQRNGRTWINEIDPSSGKVNGSFTLHHAFPEEVNVHDGYVWYVFRPFGSLQRRTLYREQMAGSTAGGS